MLSVTSRQTVTFVALFIAACAILVALDQQNRLGPVRAPVERLVEPFALLFDRAGGSVGSIGEGAPSDLERRLEEVTAERDALLAENVRLRELQEEVAQLQRQLGFQQSRPEFQLVTGNVLGRDPNGLQQVIVIDRGSNDGVRKGMAVISPDFLIGRVTDVSADRARVTLLIDATSQVGARLESTAGEGVLYGRYQHGELLELRHLDPDAEVHEGDLVVTSGRTALVPEGLVIGKVATARRNVQRDTLSVSVTPLVPYDNLQAVSVILSDRDRP